MKQILVTGGNGQLGTELKRYAWPEGWAVTAIDIDELDLRDTAAIAAMVAGGHDGAPWAAVISAGAYTAVELYAGMGTEAGRAEEKTMVSGAYLPS